MLQVSAGDAFAFALDSIQGSSGIAAVSFVLLTTRPAPPNDNFSNRVFLASSTATAAGTTLFATSEPEESFHGPFASDRTVWWSWKTQQSGRVEVCVYPMLAVAIKAGTNLRGQVPIVHGVGCVAFYAVAGCAYNVVVGDSLLASGDFWLKICGPPAPPALDGSATLLPDQNVQMRVTGIEGQSFFLQASTNLIDWESIGLRTLVGTNLSITDVETPRWAQRFYRVLPPAAMFDDRPLRMPTAEPTIEGDVLPRAEGSPGQPFRLEWSDDLQTWFEVLTGSVYALQDFEAIDRGAGVLPCRFYRVVVP